MRPSNNATPLANKAALSITTTMYDRRALDCTVDKPLVNSLNNLTFLASSLPKVREFLVADGGIQRLVDILNESYLDPSENEPFMAHESTNCVLQDTFYADFQAEFFTMLAGLLGHISAPADSDLTGLAEASQRLISLLKKYMAHSTAKKEYARAMALRERRVLVAWKWTLSLQVLVLCGTRGTEQIRKKIVHSGIIPVVSTVLDNYLLLKSGAIQLDGSPSGSSLPALVAHTSRLIYDTVTRLSQNLDSREPSTVLSNPQAPLATDIGRAIRRYVAGIRQGAVPLASPAEITRFALLFSDLLRLLLAMQRDSAPEQALRTIEANMAAVTREFGGASPGPATANPFLPDGVALLANGILRGLLSMRSERICQFAKEFPEILADSTSNQKNSELVVVEPAVHITDSGTFFWGCLSRNGLVSIKMTESGDLAVIIRMSEHARIPVVADLGELCESFRGRRAEGALDCGLQRYSGQFNFYFEHLEGGEGFERSQLYITTLAHIFKNVFFRDFNGNFCGIACAPLEALAFDLSTVRSESENVVPGVTEGIFSPESEVDETANGAMNASSPSAPEEPPEAPALAPNTPFFDGFLVALPREFHRGKIVPMEDDVTWVLQLLAFILKYTDMKDELQFSHIVPRLSLRIYPNDPSAMSFGEFSFRDVLGIERSNRSIVEDHFNKAWASSGSEFEALSEKAGCENNIVFPKRSSFGYGMLLLRPLFSESHEYQDLIEDRFFSLKLNNEMKVIKANMRVLEENHKDDLEHLFELMSEYSEICGYSENPGMISCPDDGSSLTDESSEAESVETGLVQMIGGDLLGALPVYGDKAPERFPPAPSAADARFKVRKAQVMRALDAQFEQILRVNYKSAEKMQRIQYYEDRKRKLQRQWDYDLYDFDDTNYESFLRPQQHVSASPEPPKGFAAISSVEAAYRTLKENFVHLPFDYSRSPMIVSSIQNYHQGLPFINSANLYASGRAGSGPHTTIVLKHDLDYLMIPLDFLNIFGLVEKFSNSTFPADLNHWAGIIMRNSCRKDERKGGIRQCGNAECGKWETDRKFSKCKRCKRAKYCSRDCQLKAWDFHRFWCQPAGSSGRSSER